MSEGSVQVLIDDRARLGMALLAASRWPEQEQRREPHAVHPHAKQTRQFVADVAANQPAVVRVNQHLQIGWPVDVLFTAVLRCDWPALQAQEPLPAVYDDEQWTMWLRQFSRAKDWAAFWAQHAAAWQTAANDLTAVFRSSPLPHFVGQISGRPFTHTLAIVPNLVYPALTAVLASSQDTFYLLLPPPKAVGESPPWPYAEDPGWVHAQTMRRLLQHILADTLAQLDETQQALLLHAATTLYLEQAIDAGEALAYLVRSKKQHKLPTLPLVVEDLRDYLGGENGRDLTFVVGRQA
ncbi:MAG: hypothetical protein IPM39_17705 [Chloroflexi bacterium]|nr:hypothetical protein [Chloroflexota bacterium]